MFTWFERVSMMVILLNCITLGMYQPCVDDQCVTNRCKILQVCIFIYLPIYKHFLQLLSFKIFYNFKDCKIASFEDSKRVSVESLISLCEVDRERQNQTSLTQLKLLESVQLGEICRIYFKYLNVLLLFSRMEINIYKRIYYNIIRIFHSGL